MNWIVYAMCASLLWGLSYTISEQLLKKISIASMLITGGIGCIIFGTGLGLARGVFSNDLRELQKPDGPVKLLLAGIAVYVIASAFILLATKSKNATMAAMIEISYPLFTALFAWLIFKQVQVNAGTLAGASLVMVGVACIYYFGKNL